MMNVEQIATVFKILDHQNGMGKKISLYCLIKISISKILSIFGTSPIHI